MLRALPAVFDLRDVEAYLAMARTYASIYCSRWVQRKLIVPVGPRVGVFYNLIVDPHGPSTRVQEAVHKRVRLSVVAVGAFALHQHGWTTQRPHLIELAAPARKTSRSVAQMDGIAMVLRPREWFHVMLPLCTEGVDGFALPPPEYALVDALFHRRSARCPLWLPTAEDIDVPPDLHVNKFVARVESAAVALGEDVSKATAFAKRVVALLDE
jgi:hypothetical protein